MGRRRRPPEMKPFASDPHLEGPEIGGANPSVYFGVCRRDWRVSGHSYYRLYKSDVAPSESSSFSAVRAPPKALSLVARLKAKVCGKTIVSMQSRWIVAVGGPSRSTLLFDTKMQKQINGPKLVAAKQNPVVVPVGYKVYALSSRPSYIDEPDFEPWFEVLDLSEAMVTERADGRLRLVGCSWVALKDPACFPCELTPTGFRRPPIIIVRSYVVVGLYILISLHQPNSGTYAFNTDTEEWHMFDNEYLPFVGSATLHGHRGFIFLGLSRENGPINAYGIRISSSSSRSNLKDMADNGDRNLKGSSDRGGALKLSITEFSLKDMADNGAGTGAVAHNEAGAGAGHYFSSLDTRRFITLAYWFHHSKCKMRYDKEACVSYPTKLHVKLTTYQTEDILEEPLGVKQEIAISKQQEHTFKISSLHGFSYPPIAFVLSI